MEFRLPRAVQPRPDRRSRRRRSSGGPRLAGSLERLEPRALLAGSPWSVSTATVTAQEGAPIASEPMATITDPSGLLTANDFTATVNWGDGTVNVADVVASATPGVFAVVGSHTYVEEGSETVRVTVEHAGDAPLTITETVAVSDPPVVARGGMTFTAVDGAQPADQLVATFIDPGGNESVSDYSAQILWGDGNISTGSIAFNPGGNDFEVIGGSDHVYTSAGNYTLTVVVQHEDTAPSTATSTANVSEPSVIAASGYTYTGIRGGVGFDETVATYTDPAGPKPTGDYSASIVWGDGVTTSGVISHPAGQPQFTVTANRSFADSGAGPIRVVIEHGASLPVTVVGAYSIAEAPLLLTGVPSITASEGIPLINASVATFVDLGGPEALNDYTAQIDWGDGSVSPGAITRSSGSSVFGVSGNHLYKTGGREDVTITVHHAIVVNTEPTYAVLSSAFVNDASIVPRGNYTVGATAGVLSTSQPVATFTDPGGVDLLNKYSAEIDWGDGGAAEAGTISVDQVSEIFTVSGQHTYADVGTYPVSVVVDHAGGPSATVTSAAMVSGSTVVVTGGATASATEFQSFGPQTLAVFTDSSGKGSVADYSATIDWGDGTISPGSIIAGGAAGSFDVQGSHVFSQLGVQTVSVTVHHDGAPDASANSKVVVSLPQIALATKPLTWREWTPLEAPDNALATLSFVDNTTRASINWGDGATSAGTVTPFVTGGAGAVLGSHTWTETGVYTVTVTALDGSSSVSQSFPVTVLKPTLPIPNPDSATPNEYYVAEVYEDVLRRPVDGDGLRYWSGLLDRGVPRTAVSSALLASNEYLTNFVIRPAYQHYLGRDADPSGISYWLGQMHGGLSDEGLTAALASSSEFYFNAGGGTNAGFVDALYRVVLNRAADPSGESYWVGQLARGASRFGVAFGFASSAEDRASQIEGTYLHLLGRAATPPELNQWMAAFQSGQASNESLIAGIAATDEYFFHAVNE